MLRRKSGPRQQESSMSKGAPSASIKWMSNIVPRHKGTRMAKQTLRRDEALYKKLGKEQYHSAKAKKDDSPRDYDLEWLVYQDEQRENGKKRH
jgi:hypothetical protein